MNAPSSSPSSGRSTVYASDASGGDVVVLELDRASGALIERQRVALGGVVMPLALNPARTRLYAARRSAPLAAVALAIGADGALRLLGESPLPASMAYLATDRGGRFLFGASYDGHCVSVSPLAADGRVGVVQQQLPTEPNAHAVQADPSNRFVYAACLGGNALLRFGFDAERGALSPAAAPRIAIAPGHDGRAGPRHFAFHPNGCLYVLNELDASIAVLRLAAAGADATPLQRVPLLPAGVALDGAPWAAEIRVAPDGRHLYASERRSSTLSAFRIEADGTLAALGTQPTEAQPRGFAIDPGGRWLVAAGQRSGGLSSHPVDPATGALGPGRSQAVGGDLNWVEIVARP